MGFFFRKNLSAERQNTKQDLIQKLKIKYLTFAHLRRNNQIQRKLLERLMESLDNTEAVYQEIDQENKEHFDTIKLAYKAPIEEIKPDD